MTTPRGPFVPPPRPSEEDLLELRESPYDLPGPDYPDPWLAGRPEFVIDVTQLRSLLLDHAPSPGQIPETGPARTRDPEPDLEAEP